MSAQQKLFGNRKGWLRFGILTAVAAGTCALSIAFVDRPTALWVKANQSVEWRATFQFLTLLGKAEAYVLASLLAWGAGYGLARFYKGHAIESFYRSLSRTGAFILSSLALSGIVIHILKLSMGRARPGLLLRDDFYGFNLFAFDSKLSSFPSGHSQTIWAVMLPLALVFPALRSWLLGLAVIVAFSRVMVSAHFPADVLAGSYIAIACTLYIHQRWFAGLSVPHPRSLTDTHQETVS